MEILDKDVEALIKEFEQYAESKGFILNPNREIVERIVRALLKKEKELGCRYCPCRIVKGDKQEDKKIICPCIYHIKEIDEDGHCLCWLFVRKVK